VKLKLTWINTTDGATTCGEQELDVPEPIAVHPLMPTTEGHIAWMREHVRCETCLWGYPNGCGHGLRASLKATWGCNTWEPREPTT